MMLVCELVLHAKTGGRERPDFEKRHGQPLPHPSRSYGPASVQNRFQFPGSFVADVWTVPSPKAGRSNMFSGAVLN